jgi:hypothetical protein
MQNFPSLLSNADASAKKARKYGEKQAQGADPGKKFPADGALAR